MKRRGLGLFNLHGNINNKKVMSCSVNPFGAYEYIVEMLNTYGFKSFTLLGETFPIVTDEESQQLKIYLHRFLEIAKYDFTKETRPPMRLRLHLKEERFEIVFDFDSPIIGWEEQEYIKELENEVETLRAIIENNEKADVLRAENLKEYFKLHKEGVLNLDEIEKIVVKN